MDKIIKVNSVDESTDSVSEIEEVGTVDIGQPDCKLINPVL